MNQEEIKKLLQEAANPDCSPGRRDEIQYQLTCGTPMIGGSGVYSSGRKTGMLLVLEKLYTDTLEDRPELLPSLFPVFAIICGDREGKYVLCADIDWSLVD